MKIIDGCTWIPECFEENQFSWKSWERYMAHFPQEMKQMIEEDCREYDFKTQVLPVVQSALQHPQKIQEARCSFQKVTSRLEKKIEEQFGTLDCTVILYLGLCSGAGWATDLEGKPTVLLGIEKIIELNWQSEQEMQALIYHEIGHLWHFSKRNQPPMQTKQLEQLYQEGMAMRFEQLICGDLSYYHQDKDGWLDWCVQKENQIKSEYASRIQNKESVQDFFGDWCSYQGRSDVGYFLGNRFVQFLCSRFSLEQAANLCEQQLLSLFWEYVSL